MFKGDAQFVATLDGRDLADPLAVTAIHRLGQTQDFIFHRSFGAGPHDLAVTFLNDAWEGTPSTDRNLYVDSVTLNGTQYATAAALFSNGTTHIQLAAPVG